MNTEIVKILQQKTDSEQFLLNELGKLVQNYERLIEEFDYFKKEMSSEKKKGAKEAANMVLKILETSEQDKAVIDSIKSFILTNQPLKELCQ